MIGPTQRTIDILNSRIAELESAADKVVEKCSFKDMYAVNNEGKAYTYRFNNSIDFLKYHQQIDLFVSLASRVKHILCRKFAKYKIDRSHFQARYNHIIDSLHERIYLSSLKVLRGMEIDTRIPADEDEGFEILNQKILNQTQMMLLNISKARAEWPVIPKYKKNSHWHNRGVKKNTART